MNLFLRHSCETKMVQKNKFSSRWRKNSDFQRLSKRIWSKNRCCYVHKTLIMTCNVDKWLDKMGWKMTHCSKIRKWWKILTFSHFQNSSIFMIGKPFSRKNNQISWKSISMTYIHILWGLLWLNFWAFYSVLAQCQSLKKFAVKKIQDFPFGLPLTDFIITLYLIKEAGKLSGQLFC